MFISVMLIVAALLPAIVLCVYIYKQDRVEKEPLGLLIKLLLGGALICVPLAIIFEVLFSSLVTEPLFERFILGYDSMKNPVFSDSVRHARDFVEYFFGVGLIEEAVKFVVLIWFTRKSREFNSLFDGIIYSIFVSLGFAGLENIFYVLENGFVNAVTRAVLSVPGHMFFAVMMGYYYSLWHISDKAALMEKFYKAQGLINLTAPEFKSGKYVALSLIVPTLAHGTYDFCCVYGTNLSLLILIAFVIFMYVHCFGKIKKMSVSDAPTTDYAYAMLIRKYPTLSDAINAQKTVSGEDTSDTQVFYDI